MSQDINLSFVLCNTPLTEKQITELIFDAIRAADAPVLLATEQVLSRPQLY